MGVTLSLPLFTLGRHVLRRAKTPDRQSNTNDLVRRRVGDEREKTPDDVGGFPSSPRPGSPFSVHFYTYQRFLVYDKRFDKTSCPFHSNNVVQHNHGVLRWEGNFSSLISIDLRYVHKILR